LFNTESLRPRLILIVGLALAPLALASIGRGVLRLDAGKEDADQNLRETAIYATQREQAVFTGAKQLMERLAGQPDLNAGPNACGRLLRNALIGTPLFLNAALIDPGGSARCMAVPESISINYAKSPWWPAMKVRHEFRVGERSYSSAVKREILPVALPIYRSDGAFAGTLSLSIDIDGLAGQMAAARPPGKAIMLVLDHSGNAVASSQAVPGDLAKAVAQLGQNNSQRTFVTTDATRGKWRWAAQPIGNEGSLVAFGKPESWRLGITPIYFFADIFLPILMILFAWGAIWLGTEWLVIRWTNHLKRISVVYGRGHFIGETAELAAAPAEFQLLGREMAKMASSIQARDLKLNQALRQETALAREIHHRVKNNLQIVSSLINLYARNVTDLTARLAFREITTRVDALSLVHRLIEKNGAVPVIAMKSLFSELADQIRALAEVDTKPYQLELDVDDCQLPVDIATPIALFAVEMLSLGLSGPTPPVEPIRLSLRVEDPDHLLLSVEHPALSGASLRDSMPSSARILGALCEQMGGRMWLDDSANGTRRLRLRIAVTVRSAQSRTLSGGESGWGEDAKTGPFYDERQENRADTPDISRPQASVLGPAAVRQA
jgi:two-component sensor histidine kinase